MPTIWRKCFCQSEHKCCVVKLCRHKSCTRNSNNNISTFSDSINIFAGTLGTGWKAFVWWPFSDPFRSEIRFFANIPTRMIYFYENHKIFVFCFWWSKITIVLVSINYFYILPQNQHICIWQMPLANTINPIFFFFLATAYAWISKWYQLSASSQCLGPFVFLLPKI